MKRTVFLVLAVALFSVVFAGTTTGLVPIVALVAVTPSVWTRRRRPEPRTTRRGKHDEG